MGLTLGQGKSVRSPPPEEEGAAETTCDELTVTPIPSPPAVLRWGGEGRKTRLKLSLGRREGWEKEQNLKTPFSLSYSDLIGDK